MKLRIVLSFLSLAAAVLSFCALYVTLALPAGAVCAPDGDIRFICGVKSPEDIIRVPDSDWVVVSGMAGAADGSSHAAHGQLYAIDSKTHTWSTLFPAANARVKQDEAAYPACPGPLGANVFGGHGINLQPKAFGLHTLYAVNHSRRESVEVFELDVHGRKPVATWIGCVVYPKGASGNAVVALPGGGFATTNFHEAGDTNAYRKMAAGELTGSVLEWHADTGWKTLPDSAMSGPNGIAASPDGRWLYVAGWPTKNVVLFDRTGVEPKKELVKTGILTDNLRWAADGSLLAAGQDADLPAVFQCRPPACRVGSGVVKIDLKTLEAKRVVTYGGSDTFEGATTAIEVGDEIWLGSYKSESIARVHAHH